MCSRSRLVIKIRSPAISLFHAFRQIRGTLWGVSKYGAATSNEMEISHGRVSLQTYSTHLETGALASSIGYATWLLLLSLVNAQLVAIRVKDDGSSASGCVERLKCELHVMLPEMLYRSFEIIHFKNKMGTIA